MSKNIVVNTWVDEMGQFIASETFKLIDAAGGTKGVTKKIATKFIQYFVSKLVLSVLNQHTASKISNDEKYELTKKGFLEVKVELQREIAKGFERAFKEYASRDVEYYCQVNVVPEPISKEIN